jgi:hypothetical protein
VKWSGRLEKNKVRSYFTTFFADLIKNGVSKRGLQLPPDRAEK